MRNQAREAIEAARKTLRYAADKMAEATRKGNHRVAEVWRAKVAMQRDRIRTLAEAY